MKILVTGCAGFIGYHTARRLLAAGHTVVGVDDMNDYYSPALKAARLAMLGVDAADMPRFGRAGSGNFTFIKAGIEEERLYGENLDRESFDLVCNLAAQAGVRYSIENPRRYVESNVEGFFNILEYCRRHHVTRLVYASSSSVYGNSDRMPCSETDTTDTPVSLYAATKKSNELFARCYSELYGIETIGLRFFTVYGPWGRPDMAPFIFTKAILEGEPVRVFNGGAMSRDFTYIDDIVEGVCKVLLEEPAPGVEAERCRIYNIGCSAPVNLGDFISAIERIGGKKAHRIEAGMQPGDVRDTWADVSLLKAHYGYAPRTKLERGLTEFIDWYKEYYG